MQRIHLFYALHRIARVQLQGLQPQRFNSSSAVRNPRSLRFYFLSGIFWSSGAAIPAYALYYYSGLKNAADAAANALSFLDQARKTTDGHKKPSQALGLLRQAANSYVATVPGAGLAVDIAFNSVDDAIDAHGDEANAILSRTYKELADIIQQKHESTVGTVLQLLPVIKREMRELHALGLRAGDNGLVATINEKAAPVVASIIEVVQTNALKLQNEAGPSIAKAALSLKNKWIQPRQSTEKVAQEAEDPNVS